MNIKPSQRPLKLQAGDTIGIAAPAGPFDHDALARGLAELRTAGFEVRLPPDIYARNGYLAGTDRQRAAVLQDLFADTEVKGIICARGGYGCLRMLEYLDLEVIRDNPKIFMGFSDVTVLLWVFYRFAGLATFHGPMATGLAAVPPADRTHLYRTLTETQVPVIHCPEAVCLKPGIARAPLAGGNLTTLCHLLGTPWQPCFAGHILLLEDCNEAPYRLDRMLKQMQLAGCLDDLAGLVLGSFDGCGTPEASRAVLCEYFTEIPILADFPVGHSRRNLVIPLGIMATLDSAAGTLDYT